MLAHKMHMMGCRILAQHSKINACDEAHRIIDTAVPNSSIVAKQNNNVLRFICLTPFCIKPPNASTEVKPKKKNNNMN